MTPTTQAEIERKYDVEDGVAIPDLSTVEGVSRVDAMGTATLDATYFDTVGAVLPSAAGSLRCQPASFPPVRRRRVMR